MKRLSIISALVLFVSAASGLAQTTTTDNFTGGFLMDGRWHALNVRMNKANGTATADYISPYFGGAENAINVSLVNVKNDPADVRFEIPARRGNLTFKGRQTGDTITGDLEYENKKTPFGLTRIANVRLDVLEPLYGAYRLAPDHVISILRGWGYARTLNYVDYKTGKVGTLWPSTEWDFFTGEGLAVSFPVTLKVQFKLNSSGNHYLTWEGKTGPKITATRLEVKEQRLTFKNGDITLGATLITPPNLGRHPVIIVTPGDYGTNRNQLRLWAHHYVSNGIAALIFDSRGSGDSTGQVNSSSFSDLANDVLAIIDGLKTRDDIDPKQIGLFGFSNSAFTVSLAASRSNDVAFLILQSFVGVVPWRQESYRAETQLRVDGFPAAEVKAGAELMRMKYEVGRTGVGWEQLQKTIERSRGERWLAYTSPPNEFGRFKSVYESTMTYDPVPALAKLKMPVLAMWGDQDTYLPVSETVMAFREAMKKAGNKRAVVKVYPNSNHSLIESTDGSPSTGGTERNFAPGMWQMQAEWLRKHVRTVR